MKNTLNLRTSFFILFFTVAICVSSCTNNKKDKASNSTATAGSSADTSGLVKIDTTDFTMYIPKGWTHFVKPAMGTFMAYYIMAPKEANFTPNMNVLHQNVGNSTMDDYVKLNEKQMRAMNIKINERGDTNVGTMQGKYFKSTFDMQGRTIAIKSYFCISNRTAYVVTATCLSADTAKYLPLFDRVVNTFRLK